MQSDYIQFSEWFWQCRNFCDGYENALTPAILNQWQEHNYVRLDKWERDVLFGMDRAFRRSYSSVLSWHMKRKQIKVDKDKDKGRLSKRNG